MPKEKKTKFISFRLFHGSFANSVIKERPKMFL